MVATDPSQLEWQPTSSAQVSVEFLSEADDLLTRYLWDWTLFGEPVVGGRQTAKMNLGGSSGAQRAARRTDQDLELCREVANELRRGQCTVQNAVDRLAKVKAFEDFAERWEDGDMLFLHHLKRYAYALTPTSGVAFHETNRYAKPSKKASTRQTPSPTPEPNSSRSNNRTGRHSLGSPPGIEVAVFATRKFKKGEEINLCRGGVADLTEEEDDQLRRGGQKADFSVLYSSRKKSFGLLLGPARFVNHDCRNNVEFVFGQQDMRFRAIEDIQPNEEIFTHYGIHYFEQDNAGCLCATCEQLNRGGFTPKLKPDPVPFKRETTPTRKSSRVPADSAPGTGHEVTAQRSIKNGARSRSPSSDSDSSSSSQPERRRNERRAVATPDQFRTRPRLVHPKLPPPPLYASDYEYDPRKKTIKYKGLVTVARGPKERGGSALLSATPSPVPPQPGARKRARDESPAEQAQPSSQTKRKRLSVLTVTETTTKENKRTRTTQTVISSVEKPKKPLAPPRQPKAVTPSKSTFAPPAKFKKLTSSSSAEIEVITLDDSTDGSADEDQVASMLGSRSRSSTSSKASAGFQSGSDSKPAEKESSRFGPCPPTPKSPSPGPIRPARNLPRRGAAGRAPGDEGSPTPGRANGGSTNGSGHNGEAAPAAGAGSAPVCRPTSLGLGLGSSGTGGIGAGGDGGDDGEERKPFKGYVASPVDVEPEAAAAEPMEVDGPAETVAGSSASSASVPVVSSGLLTPALSASGRDETDQEAARLLLAMGSLFGSSSASTSSTKATLPTSSSNTSVDDLSSNQSQLSAKAKGKRRATDGPAELASSGRKAEAARTNRRRSHLDEPSSGRSSQSPGASSRGSTDKRRVSQLGSSGSRSASGSRSPAPRPPPPPPAEGARGTRRSAPIKGGVHDLLSTPEVASVAGTFDPSSGKYLSARRSASVGSGLARVSLADGEEEPVASGSRSVEAKPEPLATTPAAKAPLRKVKSRPSAGSLQTVKGAGAASPPERKPLVATKSAPAATPARTGGRSTRSSFPMDATALDQLLHAPGAVGGSGYDFATGKYLPLRHKPSGASLAATEPESATQEEVVPNTEPVIYAANGTVVPPVALSPEAAAAASAAILNSATRSTRRSRPIDIPLQALISDPAVAGVSGGWDPVQQKYVMPKRAAGRGARASTGGEGEGAAGAGGEGEVESEGAVAAAPAPAEAAAATEA